jgi:hypothetical protein
VNCDDKDAKSRIVERAKSEADCEKGSVKAANGQVFCIAPLN